MPNKRIRIPTCCAAGSGGRSGLCAGLLEEAAKASRSSPGDGTALGWVGPINHRRAALSHRPKPNGILGCSAAGGTYLRPRHAADGPWFHTSDSRSPTAYAWIQSTRSTAPGVLVYQLQLHHFGGGAPIC